MTKKTMLAMFFIFIGSVAFADQRCDDSDYSLPFTSWDGETGGKAQFILNGEFDKPVILVEGFDFTNVFDCHYILDFIEQKQPGLVDDIMSGGRDLVVLDFTDSTDNIMDNVYLVERLVDIINGNYVKDIETKFQKSGGHPNAIIGLSMGGVISKFALVELEKNSSGHETSLFVSYDSPQKYANLSQEVMVGVNQILFLMKELDADRDAISGLMSVIESTFRSNAARDLLVTRPIFSFSFSSSTTRLLFDNKNYRGYFNYYNDSDEVDSDYPVLTRKVSFSNGGSQGRDSEFPLYGGLLAGVTAYTEGSSLLRLNYYPAAQSNLDNYIECIGKEPWIGQSENQSHYEYIIPSTLNGYPELWRLFANSPTGDPCMYAGTYPLAEMNEILPYQIPSNPSLDNISFDTAPGSYLESLDSFGEEFSSNENFDLTINHFSFIPTISSVDYRPRDENGNLTEEAFNLFVDLSAIEDLADQTPFDAVYLPSSGDNEAHLAITDEKRRQLLQEIQAFHVLVDSDFDNDGLMNQFELSYVGSEINNADTDGDGMDDGFEWEYGLNPTGYTANEAEIDRDGDIDSDGVSNFHEFCGSTTGLDEDCVSSFSSDPDNPDSTPSSQRTVIVTTTIVATSLLLN